MMSKTYVRIITNSGRYRDENNFRFRAKCDASPTNKFATDAAPLKSLMNGQIGQVGYKREVRQRWVQIPA